MNIIRKLKKNKKVLKFIGSIFSLVVFIGCQNYNSQSLKENKSNTDSLAGEVKYAEHFTIQSHDTGTVLQVINPWEGASDRVFQYNIGKQKNQHNPYKRVICMSSTHVAMLQELGLDSLIKGISGVDYIYNPDIRKRISQGKISEIGYQGAWDMERILSLKPDLFLAFAVNASYLETFKQLESLGVKVVIIADYLESNPLGRAEWIRFLGFLFNQPKADTLFREIESEYNNLKSLVTVDSLKPRVMSGLPYKGTWYVPGGNSWLSYIISDAGGNYIWSDIKEDVVPMELELVYSRALNADYWINAGIAESMEDIAGVDSRLTELKAVKEKHVVNNNRRVSPGGGNDYFESGSVNPHIVLRDLIHIFHPQILQGDSLVYYRYLY